ncbi:glycosyl hydrolase family 28-related protein [Cytobacillus dafuensis]|nr:glycosyl hydrolase family 28-related protein [Cytobacillus dafuensis]
MKTLDTEKIRGLIMKKKMVYVASLFLLIIAMMYVLNTKKTTRTPLEEYVYNVNDFQSIQAAITYVSKKSGGKIYFPPNKYEIKEELDIREGVELIGAGRNQTTISVSTPSGYLNREGSAVKFSDIKVNGKVRNCLNSPISPEDFGALGDAKTDDSLAFQNAANSGNGSVLELEEGKRYLIKDTVTIDIEKIKMINGNNSYLVLEEDIIGLKLLGSKETKGASPNSEQNNLIAEKEFMPIVSNLQIYSKSDSYVGTGIQAEGTFGLIIKNNHLYNLKTGIEFIGYNRNVIIENNQIWNIRNYGIHWNKVNLHQQIIENNHISFTKKNLFFEDSDVHNIHIIGNDLEGGGGEQEGNENSIHFLLTDNSLGDMSQIQIIGNSIEEHLAATSSLIKFENHTDDTSKMQIIEITGNELSGSKSNAIEFWNSSNVTINGNNFYGNQDDNIKILHKATGFNIMGNSFSGNLEAASNKGFLFLKSGLEVNNIIIYANTIDNLHGPVIQMKDNPDDPNAKFRGRLFIDGMNISNNIFTIAEDYQSNGEYLVDIEAHSIAGLVYTNNQLKGCSTCENGTRITANSINHSIINKNMIYNVKEGANKYKLPESTQDVIVSENR